jgi:hypothetical protein
VEEWCGSFLDGIRSDALPIRRLAGAQVVAQRFPVILIPAGGKVVRPVSSMVEENFRNGSLLDKLKTDHRRPAYGQGLAQFRWLLPG